MSWFTKRNWSPARCSTFWREPVSRLSTQTTLWPLARRKSQRCEPRKPPPPGRTGQARKLRAVRAQGPLLRQPAVESWTDGKPARGRASEELRSLHELRPGPIAPVPRRVGLLDAEPDTPG